MFSHNWLFWPSTLLAWLLIFNHNLGSNAGSQNAIGAYRDYPKTSFSCTGRPAGYYADVETGCQIYHMCDGLGRQFSYSCPNTTLFQQRMLICDHWYMVNCSKAESNYAANLLIGQRDKPFVNDEENSLRTPRPDLLDRPYAPDYSGESFRNQYKLLPAAQNRIQDPNSQKQQNKLQQHVAPAGQHRWKIPPPSQLILPPAYEPQVELEAEASTRNTASNKQQKVIRHSFSSVSASAAPSSASTTPRFTTASTTKTTKTTTRRSRPTTTTTTTTTTTRRPKATAPNSLFNGFDSAALHQRHEEHEDLGTSHSTRYNTSADFNSAEQPSKTKQQKPSGVVTKKPVKVPSKFYEPPVLYPIYNENETLALTTERPLRVSSASPFAVPTKNAQTTTTTTTTARSFTRPTTQAGKPFSTVFAPPTTAVVSEETSRRTQKQQNSDRFDVQKISATSEARTPTPAQGFKPRPTEPISNAIGPELPSNDLLPPYQEFILHDTATTVGPPIYYEWKIPSNGLEPPKLDPPIGVDGREYPDSAIDYNAISASDGFVPAHSFSVDQQNVKDFESKQSFSTARTPSVRSLKSESYPRPNGVAQSTEKSSDIHQIRKQLSVPEYLFPLESIGRTGYLSADTYNSFQLKIPDRHTEAVEKHEHWFGENPKCPQCHPSYVVPGTCEPCLRR